MARHAKYMTIYGSSVEGRVLDTHGVVRTNVKNNKGNKKKEKPYKVSKKAQDIINANNKIKLIEREKEEREMLTNFKINYKKSKRLNNNDITSFIKQLDVYLLKFEIPDILIEAQILKVKLLHIYNKNYLDEDSKKDTFLSIRKLFHYIKKFEKTLLDKDKLLVADVLQTIGLDEIARKNDLSLPETDKPNTTDDNWIRYQLKYLGPELERVTDGTSDSRVKNFIPDEWQRRLFDVVDKRQSALIVAPTSSGKCSYYLHFTNLILLLQTTVYIYR